MDELHPHPIGLPPVCKHTATHPCVCPQRSPWMWMPTGTAWWKRTTQKRYRATSAEGPDLTWVGAGSCRQPRSSRQAQAALILQTRRLGPETGSWTQHTKDRAHRVATFPHRNGHRTGPRGCCPSHRMGRPVHGAAGKDQCPVAVEVLPKHLLLVVYLCFFNQDGKTIRSWQ